MRENPAQILSRAEISRINMHKNAVALAVLKNFLKMV